MFHVQLHENRKYLKNRYFKDVTLIISAFMERYRHKPKLIVSAGGDEFFMIDDAKFYYDKLVGEKYLR